MPMNIFSSFDPEELQSLRKSIGQFQLLVENSLDVLSEVSETGELLYVSPSVFRVLGFQPEELVGKNIFTLIHPDDIAAAREKFMLPECSITCRCRRRNGDWRWLETAGRDFVGTGGSSRAVLVSRDVTDRIETVGERGHIEAQLRHAQKQQLIGTFASGIAHDFNNVLTILLAHADLTENSAGDPERVKRCAREIRNACDRARDLIRRILAFSRKQTSELKPAQLQVIVKEVFALLRSTLPATIEMDLHLDTTAPAVLADSTQIHQVLLNLAANSRHAMGGSNGRLTIRVSTCVFDALAAPVPDGLRPGLYARVSISDTGHGMTPEVQKRIFEPFFTTKPPGEGTGLGLAVVQGIMKEHNGFITVHSEPDKGATFELFFPAHFPGENGSSSQACGLVSAISNSAIPAGSDSPESLASPEPSRIRNIHWQDESAGEIPIKIISNDWTGA